MQYTTKSAHQPDVWQVNTLSHQISHSHIHFPLSSFLVLPKGFNRDWLLVLKRKKHAVEHEKCTKKVELLEKNRIIDYSIITI
jgi:hypothetical protein